MADKKITELPNINGTDLVDADEFVVVDISADETKAITLAELKTAFDAGTGFVRVTGDTMTGVLKMPDGSNSAPSISNTGDTNTGMFFGAAETVSFTSDGTKRLDINTSGIGVTGNIAVTGTVDGRDVAADGVLATNALPKAGGAMTGAITTNSTFDGVDIATRNAVLTTTTNTANAALPKAGGAMTGAITTNSTFDGRDVAADGVLATNALPKAGGAVTGNVTFGDNDKAIFGAGSDLSIYHNTAGFTGNIIESPVTNLYIRSNNLYFQKGDGTENNVIAISDGAVTLSYDNAPKLATTTTGVDVTGVLGVSVSSASISPDADADNLVIQQAGNAGITIGSATNGVGSIRFADSGNPRSGMIYYNHSGDHMRFYTAATERMRIDSSGNVGIGATNPDSPVTIQPAAQGVGINSVQSWMYALTSGSEFDLKLNQEVSSGLVKYAFTLRNNGTSYANNLVLDRGKVGIGIATPNQNLAVKVGSDIIVGVWGDNSAGYGAIQSANVANNAYKQLRFDASSYHFALGSVGINKSSTNIAVAGHTLGIDGFTHHTRNGNIVHLNQLASSGSNIILMQAGGTVGVVSVTSSGTTFATTSDRRLKDNIQPIADATDKLMAMKPVTHTWIADPEADAVHGFIAQEMQEIVPEAIAGDADSEEMMSMDYGRITPVLVAALQEATNEIKALKQRVSELEKL